MSIMPRTIKAALISSVIMLALASASDAHFSLLLPSDSIVTRGEPREVELDLMLLHPYEYSVFTMEQPHALILWHEGVETDISDTLKSAPEGAGNIWSTTHTVTKPGDYIIYMEPAPIFEPSEDMLIIQYAKVVLNVFGRSGDWKRPVGAKAEIVPITRPYGLWAGSAFQGRVLIDNAPAPNIEVSVEHLNDPSTGYTLKATKDESALSAQVTLADERGIFTVSLPSPGWWGIKAVSPPRYKVEYEGRMRFVEVGAVLWVYVEEIK